MKLTANDSYTTHDYLCQENRGELIYGSVCSGIEAASVAWAPLGWKSAWFSEIEKFPCEVLKHHYSDVPNLGDMKKICAKKKGKWPKGRARIDLLVGGTPCQSFSITGLRKGLADSRGNLALVFCHIAKTLQPKWIVWENVPGVLSAQGGRAFGSFLGALEKCGYGLSYRVLDAQYFGVPQRRKRVFVVGYLGDWNLASAVLFEQKSLCSNPTNGKSEGEEVAPTIEEHKPASEGSIAVAVSGCATPKISVELNSTLRSERQGYVVYDSRCRRLTPKECERLQGFPDDYTNIPGATDTDRYKALGNSMAVPVMGWIGQRIQMVEDILFQMEHTCQK